MRMILSCDQCKLQYDATGRVPGHLFHCHCGNVVKVAKPKGHDARVVRCSACGGPREQSARECTFCHSDFTLHERDLHTVCPECLARVSDQAKFCHHCGIELVPELTHGSETPLFCPGCDDTHLVSRRLGKEMVTVLECDRCAGLWLGNDAFEKLADRVAKEALSAEITGTAKRPSYIESGDLNEKWRYRDLI